VLVGTPVSLLTMTEHPGLDGDKDLALPSFGCRLDVPRGDGRSQDGGACSPRNPVSVICRYRLPALPGIPCSLAVQNAIISAP
jgi:hypothetical protein